MGPSSKQQRRSQQRGGSPNKNSTKQSGGKKQQQQQPRKLSVAELVQAAEHAVAGNESDPTRALTLITLALQKCDNGGGDATATLTTTNGKNNATSNIYYSRSVLLEKRAEVHMVLCHPDAALLDYRAALQAAVATTAADITTNTANTNYSCSTNHGIAANGDDHVDACVRQAGLCMYIGQLSVAAEALASYHQGCAALEAALNRVVSIENDDTTNTEPMTITTAAIKHRTLDNKEAGNDDDDDDEETHSVEHVRQQLATACCSIAELYLTDLCLEDDAEQQCGVYIQKALTMLPDCVEAWQLGVSWRLSSSTNRRRRDALFYMQFVYQTMEPACRAVAGLVGLLPQHNNSNKESSNSSSSSTDSSIQQQPEAAATRELSHVEQVQNLPDFPFRCQTAKLLLECAHVLLQDDDLEPTDINDPTSNHNNSDDGLAGVSKSTNAALSTPHDCAEAAVAVLASLLAEDDTVVEIWTLMGDALQIVEQQHQPEAPAPLAFRFYWQRALEMLAVVQSSLEQELRDKSFGMKEDNDSDNNDDDDDDDNMQQQLDQVLGHIQDLQAKLNETESETNEDAVMSSG